MIVEVSPLATVVLDGSGNGQVSIGPPAGTKWALRLASVAVSSSTKQPQASLYRGSPSGPIELVDSTPTGAAASSNKVGGPLYYPGQRLWAVWSGGDAGATATLQAFGQQGNRNDPLAASPPGEGFPQNTLSITLPYGATTGGRIVLNGATDEIFMYDASGLLRLEMIAHPLITGQAGSGLYTSNDFTTTHNGWIGLTQGLLRISLATINGLTFENSASVGVISTLLSAPGGAATTQAGLYVRAPVADGQSTVGAAGLRLWSRSFDNTSDPSYVEVDADAVVSASIFALGNTTGVDPNPAATGTLCETWHALTLQNSWGGTLQYRLVPSPANCVQLQSTGLTVPAGGRADGTLIGTLPTGYRPSASFDVLGTANATVAGGQTPHFNVATNGQITCFGYSSASQGGLFGLIPKDF